MSKEEHWGVSSVDNPKFIKAQQKRTNEFRELMKKAKREKFLAVTYEAFEKALFNSLRGKK